jgi:hypothetical protein
MRVTVLTVSMVALAATFGGVRSAQAVILYSSATRNTSPPVPPSNEDDGSDEGWNYEATWGSFLATPIDATHFIAAKHIGDQGSTIVYQGNAYQVNESSEQTDPGSDLAVWTLQGGLSGNFFPSYAPLYNASPTADGSLIGKTLTVMGRGTQRGGAVIVGGATAGWYWGAGDGVESWGQNVVTGVTTYNSVSASSLLYYNFDGPGANQVANECMLSVGDSSGGLFVFSNGQWKLAGINYAVDNPWSFIGSTSDEFDAAIFDARGLYYPNGDGTWSQVPPTYPTAVPAASFDSNISDRRSWIESVDRLPGDANLDGKVDVNDLTIVLANFGQTGCAWSQGCMDGDPTGTVDVNDLTIVLANYNQTFGSGSSGIAVASAVPEPSCVIVLGIGAVSLLAFAWRRHGD